MPALVSLRVRWQHAPAPHEVDRHIRHFLRPVCLGPAEGAEARHDDVENGAPERTVAVDKQAEQLDILAVRAVAVRLWERCGRTVFRGDVPSVAGAARQTCLGSAKTRKGVAREPLTGLRASL